MGYGPIQMLVVGFDGNRFRGEIWPELERLKQEGVVRIIDMMLVRKDAAGAVTHIVASDLDWEEAAAFGEAMGALAGFAREGLPGVERGGMKGLAEMMDGHMFDEDDIFRLEQLVPAGMTTAVVLFEHVWAASVPRGRLACEGLRAAERVGDAGADDGDRRRIRAAARLE